MSEDKNLETLLKSLHAKLIETLLDRIKSGKAKPADLAVARQLLKDNGIDSVPEKDPGLGDLARRVPFGVDQGDYAN
jgi:hypothetical protein